MILNDMSIIIRYNHIFMNRSLAQTDISSNENYLLMYLYSRKEATQDEISLYFEIDKGSISKTVSSLEEKGYVQRTVNSENRRSNFVMITQKGIETFAKNKKLIDLWHQEILENITEEEINYLSTILSKMAHNAVKALEKAEFDN